MVGEDILVVFIVVVMLGLFIVYGTTKRLKEEKPLTAEIKDANVKKPEVVYVQKNDYTGIIITIICCTLFIVFMIYLMQPDQFTVRFNRY